MNICKLGDIAKFTTGKLNSNAAQDNGKYPFFTCAPEALKIDDYAFDTEAIILAGNNADGNFHIQHFKGKFNAYQRTYVIESSDENKVYTKYLYYALKTCLLHFKQISQGSATKFLTAKILNSFELPIPEIEIQKKIAGTLGNLDKKIKTNEAINENLLQQAVAVFNKFYDTSTNLQPFTTLINVLGGGTPKTGNPEFWDGSIPFFTPKDVGTPYTFKTEKYITEAGLNHCNSRLYPQNTTFVTARGTVGKISLAGSPMAMNQSCYALASKIVDPLLVYFYVLKAVTSLKHKASGAVFDAIVTRDFDGEMINILSDTDSESALSIIKPMMEAIHNNSKENMRLSAVRDALLPKLISGEIDVSSLDI